MTNFQPIRPNYYRKQSHSGGSSVDALSRGHGQITGKYRRAGGIPVAGTASASDINSNVLNNAETIDLTKLNSEKTVSYNTPSSSSTSSADLSTRYYTNITSSVSFNPSANRLAISGLPAGGSYATGILDANPPAASQDNIVAFTDNIEDRVRITDQTTLFMKNYPALVSSGGVIFPYTPVISISHKASYEMENLVHSNYGTPYYTYSTVEPFQIQGRFTAQTPDEANYVLSVLNFFKAVTKMFYGKSTGAAVGTPPPVLFLDGYGQYVLDHIPILISEFSYTLPYEVNYITTKYNTTSVNKVPTDINMNITCIPAYSRNKISNEFDLSKFSAGGLLSKNSSGGWL